MASSVFFKFKSQKDPQRVEFDGTGISVFELKRDIIIKSGLGDGTDFDLVIYKQDSNEEYDDDTTIIPRSTSVTARRMPPMKPGAGRAARYMLGKMPNAVKNASRREAALKPNVTKAKPTTAPNLASMITENMTDDEKMAAMFSAQSEQWKAQQEEMAVQTKVNYNNKTNVKVPDHPPPPGYVCYRCGEKGHWIQVCPTNDDPNFENKPKIKRTTGIPRSFLKTVEKPVAVVNDGTIDDSKGPSGVMINAEGESVIWEPDTKAWQKFQAKTNASAAAQEAAALGDKELQDRGLECPLDKRQFLDPMKTPCCEKTYCNDCITNALIDSDFVCPGCQTDGVFIDDLIPDTETSKKIDVYLVEKEAAKAEKARSKSPSLKPESPQVKKTSSPAPNSKKSSSPAPNSNKALSPAPKSKSKSKSPEQFKDRNSKSPNPETAPAQGKKRPAEDQLQSAPKIPKGPKAMQQNEAPQQQTMMNGMNGMNGIPNMGFPMMPGFGNNNFGGMPMMPGYGMGMPNGMMMNPMMGGMNNFGGFPNMNGMNGYGAGGFGGMGGMGGMGMMNNHVAMGRGAPMNMNGGGAAGFSNQQKTVFAEPLLNEEDNAYFRQPVNPHRHQGRQRKARPSDYREV